jgi:arylsulfatase A-like enzyme
MIGELIDGLRDRHLLDEQTLIVLIADHGEQFGEHGQWEHGDVHRENIEVPWILAGAGLSPLRLTEVASVLDLAPTILDLVGVEALPFAEGRSRGPSLTRVEASIPVDSKPIVTEYGLTTRIVQDAWVLIDRGASGVQLFDSKKDPREAHDVSGQHQEVVQRLRAEINRHRERPASAAARASIEVEVDPETRRALRALGYAEE